MSFWKSSVVAGLAVTLACASSGSQSRETGAMATPSSDSSRQGSAAASTTGQDPIMQPGPQVKGHAEDQVVTGLLGQVSPHTISIQSSVGDTTTLEIVPETSIVVEGRDGTYADLREGQPVRASYANVEGHDVAVEIHAGVSSATGGTMGTTGSGMPDASR